MRGRVIRRQPPPLLRAISSGSSHDATKTSVAAGEVDAIQQFAAAEPALQILHQQISVPLPQMLADGAYVWRDENVVEIPKRAVRRQRFLLGDVEGRAGNFALLECVHQSRFVHQRPARNVDEICGGLHQGKFMLAHHVPRLGRFGSC